MSYLQKILKAYDEPFHSTVSTQSFILFIRALAVAFLIYWLRLANQLGDWLGTDGFHLTSSGSIIFAPLPPPWPAILWVAVFASAFLMFFRATLGIGCALTSTGFFYATMTALDSIAAANIHFLFAFSVILWSTSLCQPKASSMPAWPVYLLRLYLVTVYFGSGWRKAVYGNWLDDPHALFRCLTGFYTTNLTRTIYHYVSPYIWTLAQYATVVFELGAPLLLLYPPLRKTGVCMGCLLHLGIAFAMKDLFYFSLPMLAFYIPFLIPVIHRSDGDKEYQLDT